MNRMRAIGLTAVATVVLPCAGWAQGCVLCYTSAANGGPGAMRAFQMGIIALLAPALTLCIAVALLIYRRALIASGVNSPSLLFVVGDVARKLFAFFRVRLVR